VNRSRRCPHCQASYAAWLLAGSADLQVVRQRLGHGSLRTTERYLHTLPDADETALDACPRSEAEPPRAEATHLDGAY
jgi:site-specific recombinase XerD